MLHSMNVLNQAMLIWNLEFVFIGIVVLPCIRYVTFIHVFTKKSESNVHWHIYTNTYIHIHSTVVADAVAIHNLCADSLSFSPQKKIHCKQNDTDSKQCGACLTYMYFQTSYGSYIGNLGKFRKSELE